MGRRGSEDTEAAAVARHVFVRMGTRGVFRVGGLGDPTIEHTVTIEEPPTDADAAPADVAVHSGHRVPADAPGIRPRGRGRHIGFLSLSPSCAASKEPRTQASPPKYPREEA